MAKLTKDEIKQQEIDFQKYLKEYRETGSTESWHRMWPLVQSAVSNIMKSKLKGIIAEDFEGKVIEATLRVMTKIKQGTNPEKLSSFVYFPIIEVLYNKKQVFHDQCISLDEYFESH